FLILSGLACILWMLSEYSHVAVPALVLIVSRWAAIVALACYGVVRRSLTAWIIIGMIVGAEIGHDWPKFAAHLQVLSAIFLRLIKTIVAPLIFSTLVVGIASHSNLKQVGRMGIKALLYFEIVTTLALFIGLGPINLSQAGAGLTPPASAAAAPVSASAQKASDVILHIFPENIAKSVAEGQVLQ